MLPQRVLVVAALVALTALRETVAWSGPGWSNSSAARRGPGGRSGPDRLEGYEIGEEIGRGGMASVYLARQVRVGRQVAIKVLRDWDGHEGDTVDRFRSEAQQTGMLRHPNVVTVHDYVERPENAYLVMEHLAWGSLRPLAGRLSLAQIGTALEGVLEGLAHVAEHGLVHRDVKPDNLLLGADGRVRIIDFGIAESMVTKPAPPTSTIPAGTPHYLAPEQVLGGCIGPWTDLYSVGLTAFELLVGRKPFAGHDDPVDLALSQLTDPVPRPRDVRPDTNRAVDQWVGWLAAKAPADRPQSAGEAWHELDRILVDVNGPRWREAGLLPRQVSVEQR